MAARVFSPWTLKGLIKWALIPSVILELALFPFWLTRVYVSSGWLPLVQLSITAIFLPLYLAILGVLFSWRGSVREVVSGLAVLAGLVALIIFLDYSVWGVSTGMFWTPDYETVVIIRDAGEIALLIVLLPPIVTLLIRYFTQHAHRNA